MDTSKSEQDIKKMMQTSFENSLIVSRLNFKFISIEVINYNISSKSIVVTARNAIDVTLRVFYLIKQEEIHSVISNTNGDGFFIAEFLEYKEYLGQLKKLNREKYEPVEVYLDRYLRLLSEIFLNELKNIIDGERWDEIPSDFISNKVGWMYK